MGAAIFLPQFSPYLPDLPQRELMVWSILSLQTRLPVALFIHHFASEAMRIAMLKLPNLDISID